MHRPKRKIVNRSLEYNNGMLHEEEVALRRALHASLASKNVDDEPKRAKTKQSKEPCFDKSLSKKQHTKLKAGPVEGKEDATSKRKTDESVELNDKKRQKKLLVRIKPKSGKERACNSGIFKHDSEKKSTGIRSKLLNVKKRISGSEGKIKKRRKKKNVDIMKDDRNSKTDESLAKVHVQRKFAQINPTSPKSLMLYQSQMQPMKSRAKTEDFLDFLCLRGSTNMPKSLEIFNNPCAPMSPLTDEEDSDKTTPSKTSTNEKQEDEIDAKRNLVMQLSESHTSSGYNSLVSSPVSTRVQPRTVLPQFTNNHGVLTHIPTPIPYPTPPTPSKQPGFDVYGALSNSSSMPSLVPHQPRVSAVVMETHMSPEKQGFHAVGQSTLVSKETLDLSPQNDGETSGMVSETLKPGPSTNQDSMDGKSSCKRKDISQEKGSPNKEKVKKNAKKSLNSDGRNEKNLKSIKSDTTPGLLKDSMESTKLNMSDQNYNSVPVFSPTEVEFKNPFKFIESIKPKAESFGMCVIVPPDTWQPEYCLSDEIRFTTKLQRIHCLGKNIPAVEYQLAAIKKHLGEQNILLTVMPQISGCEVDLPLMSKVVEEFGGLQQIIDKRKWVKVADRLRIPKTGVDRITKLEHIYYKYLLSYDLLSQEDKSKLYDDVLKERKQSGQQYMIKGRSMSLANFQRNAKNINDYYMKHAEDKNVEEVFWQIIEEGEHYVVVHTAELDGSAFPTSKLKPFSKSKWNLNVLPKAPGSLTRDLPDVQGITSPILKVDMVLSAETWHLPSHDFYTLEYLHQGESKIWYSLPRCSKEDLLKVIENELNEDIDEMKNYMIPQSSLANSGIPVYKIFQEPGQFVVKFPGAYHSSLSTGFAVSEFVSFAPLSYLSQIKATFQTDLDSEVDHLFSWESLIVSSVKEELRRNGSEDVLNILIPEIKELRDVEKKLKDELATFGIVEKSESMKSPEKKSRSRRIDSGEIEKCNLCNRFCFPSSIMEKPGRAFCLHHGQVKVREEKSSDLTIASHISLTELNELVKDAEQKLEQIRASPRKVRKRQTGASTVSEGSEKES